jgi:hypothetical protein
MTQTTLLFYIPDYPVLQTERTLKKRIILTSFDHQMESGKPGID